MTILASLNYFESLFNASLSKISGTKISPMPPCRYHMGAYKYCISTLGVGGGSEGNAYFAYGVRGGVEAKCLYRNGSKFLFT